MNKKDLFRMALGISEPWQVVKIEFNAEKHRLDLYPDFPEGSNFPYPVYGKSCSAYDTDKRSWRHLNFFEHLTYLHARLPRVKCDEHRVKTVGAPWARPGAGFTLLFEALIMTFAKNGMTPKAISRLVGEHDTRIWRVLEHYVEASRAKEDFSSVSMVGVDETSRAKGHIYVTLFADMEERKVIFATEGKDHTTVESFRQDLEEHGGDALKITDFSIDMSKAFIRSIVEKFENAAITFDKFHVIKIINDAVDKVRRAEQKQCPNPSFAVTRPKRTRYVWLKNEENHTDNQREIYEELKDSTLKTARACRIKDTLQKLYEQPAEDAPAHLKRWYFWATHSRLTPIIKAAKTIKAHWDGVMRWFESGLNNGLMEGINSLVQLAKARARGYRSTKKMKVIIYLIAGKLNFDLPRVMPYATHTK